MHGGNFFLRSDTGGLDLELLLLGLCFHGLFLGLELQVLLAQLKFLHLHLDHGVLHLLLGGLLLLSGMAMVVLYSASGQDVTIDVTVQGISDPDGLGPFNYQWKRGGVAIAGATSTTYVLTNADVGSTITVQVSYTDGHGTPESVNSAATTAVANVNDAPILNAPFANQSVAQGALLQVSFGKSFSDVDKNDLLTYSATQTNGSPLPAWLTRWTLIAPFCTT